MKRALETPGSRLVTKRRRPSRLDLVSHLKPCFKMSSLDTEVNWSELMDRLCCAPKPSSAGLIWYAVYKTVARDVFKICVISPDGTARVVADDLQGNVSRIDPRDDECVFLTAAGAICCVSCHGGLSMPLVESRSMDYRCYANGMMTVPAGSDRKVVERRDTNGKLIETLQLGFALKSWTVSLLGNEIITTMKSTIIQKIDLSSSSRSVCTVAGLEMAPGREDGHGSDARFYNLKLPNITGGDHVFVRDRMPNGKTRNCLLHIKTHKVTTLQFRGLEPQRHYMFGNHLHNLLFLSDSGVLSHLRLDENIHASTFIEDMRALDWSERVEVKFRLGGDGVEVGADRRMLCARSEYFAAMLGPAGNFKEAQGSVVDLPSSSVDALVFRTLLAYLATDELDLHLVTSNAAAESCGGEFEGSGTCDQLLQQALFCLNVASLADQYQLPRLVGLADAFVIQLVLAKHDELVLPVLEQTLGTGSAVEEACWEAFNARPAEVCSAMGYEEIVKFLVRAPQLGGRLFLQLAGVKPQIINLETD